MVLNLPHDWLSMHLCSVAKVSIGLVTTMTEHYTANGVSLIRNSDIKENKILKERLIKLTSNFAEQFPTRILKVDDIVTVHTGDVGVSAVIDKELEGSFGFATLNTRPKRELIDSQFLCWFFNSPRFLAFCVSLSTGDGRQNLNLKDFAKIMVPVPTLPEQRKIATILSTWDKAITTTEQLLANSHQQKKALMQQLLTGKKRLLDEKGERFRGEWKVSKLSKLFERVTTKNNGQSKNVVTISGQHGLIRQEDFFKKTVASEILDGYFLLKQGQFAYNKSYSNGYPMGAIKRLNRYPDGVVTTLYICFELSDSNSADTDFWEHYFESGLLNQGLSQIAHEGGRAHGLLNVKPSDFFSLKVPTPSFEEQQKIAAVLTTADQEIEALQHKLEALKQEKKALMQQLLTGKRRVKVDEVAA